MADGETLARPGLDEALSWKGHRLDEIGGANVGRIDGVFVDVAENEPEWLLVRIGRFGHHTLVPARDAVEGVGRVWVPYARDAIRRAPKADPISSLTAGAELALVEHYRIRWGGRAGELAERDPEQVSVRPASGG